ncbi:MAG: TolC family protein [Bacteroidetes bacterium]|nr:TolC family protein [Bacteroidota bacterium]
MHRMKFLVLFATVSVLVVSSPLKMKAQTNVRKITLEEAVSATLKNNKALQLAKLDENIAESNFKQTASVYLPMVNFSYTAINTNNPLNAFGFKLEQKSISQSDFNPDLLNHPSGTPDFTTKLELQQPLVNMDMLYMRRAAQKQTELYRFKTQRTQEYLVFETQKAYLQLQLAYDAVQVLEQALQTVKLAYTYTDNHFQQGLVQKSDLLNVQVQVATVESNLEKARSNIYNASDYLNLLMGQPMGLIYSTDRITDLPLPSADSLLAVPASRADFVAMQKAMEAKNLMIQSDKMSFLPKLNAFGSYQLNDGRMFGFAANSYLAGLQLSWNIFKGNRIKNSIQSQVFERDRLAVQLSQQQEEGNRELAKTKRDIEDGRFQIVQYKTAIEQAEESLRILQNRYNQGLVSTTELMMATSQVSQQKLALAQALFNQNLNKAYLQLLTTSSTK